jgi:putative Ca2+/H+ antiporter (TMEM165/GDT1 family)
MWPMKATPLSVFLGSIIAVMIAELPCVVRTAAITAKVGYPVAVFLGTMVGTAVVMALSVWCGDWIRQYVSERTLQAVAGAVFIVLGLLMLLGKTG